MRQKIGLGTDRDPRLNRSLQTDLDDDDDYDVRTYTNLYIEEKKIDILGETWDSKSICTDFTVVTEILRDFLETGTVSTDLLK